MISTDFIFSNITVEMDTALVPPALITCDVCTSSTAKIIDVQTTNNSMFVKGIVRQNVKYQTFDVHSNIVSNELFNEKPFTALINFDNILDFDCNCLCELSCIPLDAFTVSATSLTKSLSGLGQYHRISSIVSYNLSETLLVSIVVDPNKFTLDLEPTFLDEAYLPQITGIINRGFSVPLKGSLSNCSLSNLNIKRFLVTNISKVFSESLLCEGCMLYSFFNNQNELVCSEKYSFNFILNDLSINSADDYSIVGSDILGVVDSCVCNNKPFNTLNETLSFKIIAQRIN